MKGLSDFAIIEFPPRGSRRTWRYATNGMSSYSQPTNSPGVTTRTELFASTRQKADWVDDLLAAISSYPKDNDTFFADGDTISVEQPIDRARLPYTGILLAPPGPDDPPTLGVVGEIRHDVLVHQVVGLLPRELEFAMPANGNVLWQCLKALGEALLDESRPPVV